MSKLACEFGFESPCFLHFVVQSHTYTKLTKCAIATALYLPSTTPHTTLYQY